MSRTRLDPELLRPSGALLQTQLRLAAEIDARAVAPTGHDPTILDLLVRLDLAPDRSERASRLCRQLGLSAGHMSRTIDRAEVAGLVARRPDPDDRRAQLVTLTSGGDEALDQFSPRLHAVLLGRVVHDVLEPDEITALVDYLERIEHACERLTESDDPASPTEETTHA